MNSATNLSALRAAQPLGELLPSEQGAATDRRTVRALHRDAVKHPSGRVWIVSQNHPLASDTSAGSLDRPMRTISAAAARAWPGDIVQVHSGVYRERVAPARSGKPGRPITFAAADGERVVITASDTWSTVWRQAEHSEPIFEAKSESPMFAGDNPLLSSMQGCPGKTCSQVFIDGAPQLEVINPDQLRALPGSWLYDPDSRIIRVHMRPGLRPIGESLVEVTTRPTVFAPLKRGLGYITVRGFILEHAGNNMCGGFWVSGNKYPQAGALSTRSGHHWVIEHNTVRLSKTVGIDCGIEGWYDRDGNDHGYAQYEADAGHHVIQHNTICDNGAGGVIGFHARDVCVTDNVIERNARLGLNHSETAGLKFHGFHNGLIARNLIRDNDAPGIWLDNGWTGARVTRNLVVANAGAGLFIELGDGPLLVDNNIVAYSTATMVGLTGDGVYSHDASRVTLAHNLLFFNANFGVWAHVGTDRDTRGGHGGSRKLDTLTASSHWQVTNNLIVGNHHGAISLPVPSDRSAGNASDHNLITNGFHRLTGETYAEGLDAPLLLVNTNKQRQSIDELVALFASSLDTAGVPQHNRPNLTFWREHPYLTLEQWRLLTGYDRFSQVPTIIRPELSKRALFLRFSIDSAATEVAASRVAGVDVDYFGRPMPDANPVPGPFQELLIEPSLQDRSNILPNRGPFNGVGRDNLNDFQLWPLPTER